MSYMKINPNRLFLKLVLLFPITTLFQTMIPQINKILFGIIFILLLTFYLKKLTLKNMMILLFLCITMTFDIVITKEKLYNSNELFYLPFFVIFYTYISDNNKKFHTLIKENKKYVYNIIYIWTILVAISLFMKSSWVSEWGKAKYFGSLCKSVWRFVPTCTFISSLIILIFNINKDKHAIYLMILPMFGFFMSGSRTYMVVGICLFIIFWYYYVNKKINFILSLLPISAMLIIAILNSAMVNKFNAVSYNKNSYFDYMGTITSGRSIFWKADIENFKSSGFINKMLGNGFNFIYKVNYKAFGGLVWAHNDFIQCIVSHGIIGLIMYIYTLLSCILSIINAKKDKLIFTLAILVWLFNAFFNMFYTYFCSMLSFPFLLFAITDGMRKFRITKKVKNEEDIKSIAFIKES